MKIFSFEYLFRAQMRSVGMPQNIYVGLNYVLWWSIDGKLYGWKLPYIRKWSKIWRSNSVRLEPENPEDTDAEGCPVALRVSRQPEGSNRDMILINHGQNLFPLTFPWSGQDQDFSRVVDVFRDAGYTEFDKRIIVLRSAAEALCSWG